MSAQALDTEQARVPGVFPHGATHKLDLTQDTEAALPTALDSATRFVRIWSPEVLASAVTVRFAFHEAGDPEDTPAAFADDPWPVLSPIGDLVPLPRWARTDDFSTTMTFIASDTATVYVTECSEQSFIEAPEA
jgi:hypothetical protein